MAREKLIKNDAWENLPDIDLGIDISGDWMKLWEGFCRKNKLNPVLPIEDPKDRDEQSINAYFMLIQIVRIKNKGWTPDWKNSSQYKYYPYFWMDKTGSGFVFHSALHDVAYSSVGSRLCFPDSKSCEETAKEFLPIYRVYFVKE